MNGFYIKNIFRYLLLSITVIAFLNACSDSSSNKKRQRQHLVNVTSVVSTPMQSQQILSGSLEAKRTVQIFNQEEGLILNIPVFQSDVVEKEQLLIELDSKLITAEHNKAKIAHRQAALDLKRLKQLRKKRLTTEEAVTSSHTTLELARAEETVLNTRLQNTRIKSPFKGIISQRLKESGDVVAKFSHILTLEDTSQLKAKVNISELLLPNIQLGSKISIRIDALGDKSYPASISRIYPTIDKLTRQGTIEVTLDSPPPTAKPGQLCRLIIDGQTTPRKNIPLSAVKHNFKGSYVYKVVKNKSVLTQITTGIQLGNNIEIINGLNDGDKVVVKGFLNLKDKKPVKIVNDKQ